ncbi:putative leucine-rich repeat-containing protein DDB_G0290503 isoform X1 [Tribolium castaneum]|uniref:putative leucine-rich repeat-containing protein DDB_G0290503 isoform X1 n=1 Tax=Tribolium castaneum TaxID=7070 RepID=UPI00077DB431|nr:PREDICTED: putative leucine-rich repeat-containing protein DDB_G0290503 isoform X1 [Tribolium castaneum]XP_015839113.1 PREDICTED: putative leucine-rich repeat-containing protein DDB_G0290503 isoform X1 [Tribolium castaneum]XP_015839114.1 PREDICTED: putative leucine-rich repeat-containing protein DDB_G0290503 isoform X1 [Tribolium castaneum]|eukprot:XP_015839112.1 PREDICTED: putative leucine-rich repeat-containing protein DDB_G0290503 isoform X1 [Tribolium castaneum]
MFCPMLKNPCAPPPTSPKCPPPKTHYFFVERTPTEAPKKRSNSHPRSASKSSNGSRKCCACGSKNASSDSKIIKNKSNNKRSATPARNNNKESNNNNKGSKIDPDSVKQLKQDLKTIKDQLTILTQNRDEALNLTNELEVRYKSLLEKSQRQEREIEELTQKNVTLESKCQSLGKSQSKSDLNELNALFRELVDKSKIMEESKNKVCRCIKEKSHEYQEMANSTKELSKVIAERDAKYATLMKNYQKTRENETKLKEFNQRLVKTVEELESQLHQAMMEIEASHQEASALAQKYQHELNETSKTFTEEMQQKAKEMADLNSVILELKTRVSQTAGMETKFVQLLQQYKSVNEKLKSAQDLCQCSDRTDELEMQKKKEKNLVCELVDLRQTVADLSRCKCDDGANLADLRGTNDEKEKIIQYQRAELASKDKQIDLLLKNEDRMKNKLVQLQEKLVEMKMSTNNHHQSKVLCGDVCSANLTQELQEIITALYEEIEKGLSKDEQILSQNREICNLQCTLNTKEKALIYACNQLKILRDQFQATLNEKRTLAEQLQDVTVESTFEDSSDPNAEECSCASC